MQESAFGYQLAGIAAGVLQGRAAAASTIVDAVSQLFNADSAVLIRSDDDGQLRVAHAHGYGTEALRLMTAPELLAQDPAIRSLDRDRARPPIRWWYDRDYVYETSPSATEYLIPEGYRGGLSMRFRLTTGHHVGDLHLSTRRELNPSSAQLQALDLGWPALSSVVSRGPTTTSVAVGEREFIADLGGMNSKDAAAIRRMLVSSGERHQGSYSFRLLTTEQRWYRVDVLDSGACSYVRATVDDLPAGITTRELSVLDLMCTGLTNAEIGRALFLSERTVAHNVERILMKLDARSRAGAVALAVDHGLRLTPPRQLH